LGGPGRIGRGPFGSRVFVFLVLRLPPGPPSWPPGGPVDAGRPHSALTRFACRRVLGPTASTGPRRPGKGAPAGGKVRKQLTTRQPNGPLPGFRGLALRLPSQTAPTAHTGCLKDSQAEFYWHREMDLDFVCEAVFSCILMCGASPGDLGGSRRSASAENPRKTGPSPSSRLVRSFRDVYNLPWDARPSGCPREFPGGGPRPPGLARTAAGWVAAVPLPSKHAHYV